MADWSSAAALCLRFDVPLIEMIFSWRWAGKFSVSDRKLSRKFSEHVLIILWLESVQCTSEFLLQISNRIHNVSGKQKRQERSPHTARVFGFMKRIYFEDWWKMRNHLKYRKPWLCFQHFFPLSAEVFFSNKSSRSKQKTLPENGFQSMRKLVLCEKHTALRFSIQNIVSLCLGCYCGWAIVLRRRHPQGNISHPSPFPLLRFSSILRLCCWDIQNLSPLLWMPIIFFSTRNIPDRRMKNSIKSSGKWRVFNSIQ